jgi:hypothetical protein
MFGPTPDLLLGCGVGYALLVGGLALLPAAPETLLRWGVLATFVTGMPHYGATLLRVYEFPADRRRYAFFAVWASLAVWLAFAAGIHVPVIGSVLMTLYLTWSPWHYSGQNYGLAVMFLRRRGISLDPALKRPLYASFILSYGLAVTSLHAGYASAGYVPFDVLNSAYGIFSPEIPRSVYVIVFGAILAGYVSAVILTLRGLQRRTDLRASIPTLLLMASQAIWFSIPSIALWWSGALLRAEYVLFYFVWVGIAHAVQYLWITTYYAAGGAQARGRLAYLAKALVAGGLVFMVPALVFAPGLLGRVPFEIGLWPLIIAAVNLQHFVLDGAIWKLRDGRVARILLNEPDPDRFGAEPLWSDRAWLRKLGWSFAGVCTVLAIGAALEYEVGWVDATARGDPGRANRA